MIRSKDQNTITNNIDNRLKKLVSYTDQKLPPTNSEQETAAGEYWLAVELARKANSLAEVKAAVALQHGVIFDKTVSTLPPGTNKETFVGEHFTASVKVNNPTDRVDVKALIALLIKAKIDSKVIDTAVKGATKPSKAPHIFTILPRLQDTNYTTPNIAK